MILLREPIFAVSWDMLSEEDEKQIHANKWVDKPYKSMYDRVIEQERAIGKWAPDFRRKI